MEHLSDFISLFSLFLLFHCTFQQTSFTVFSGKTGQISSIALTDGNFSVFLNAVENGKFQEYAQKLNAEGTLRDTYVRINPGHSHSIPSVFLPMKEGNWAMYYIGDDALSNYAIYENDLKTELFRSEMLPNTKKDNFLFIKGEDYYWISLIGDYIMRNLKGSHIYILGFNGNPGINQYSLDYEEWFEENILDSIIWRNSIAIELKNKNLFMITSVLDSSLNSYYLAAIIFTKRNYIFKDWNDLAIKIDFPSPAKEVNHTYPEISIETLSGNIIIVYQSSSQTSLSNFVVKYTVLDKDGIVIIKAPSLLSDSDSPNVKYPKTFCLSNGNGNCIISWINENQSICFQKINGTNGDLIGTTLIGPNIKEQATNNKAGSLLRLSNDDSFMYFHAMTNDIVGWKFDSNYFGNYTAENCSKFLSKDGRCSEIQNCLIYLDDRSGCKKCNDGKTLTVNGILCVLTINDCVAYSDLTGKCTSCEKSKIPSETGVLCANAITDCIVYSDTLGLCKTCNSYTFLSTAGDNTCKSCSPYTFLSSNGICTQCSKGCSVCSSTEKCTACQINYFLEEDACVKCGEIGTNCKSCSTIIGICDVCISGYFFDASLKSCLACDSGCITCTSPKKNCLSCSEGYFLNNEEACQKCPANCLFCSSSSTCQTCIDFYILNSLKNCVKLELNCSSESVKKYILYSDQTCTACMESDYYIFNKNYCIKMLKPIISASLQLDGKIKAKFNCAQGNKVYWAYGLGGSAFLNLQQIQELNTDPTPDPIYYRTVGSANISPNQDLNIDALPNIKNSGELYTLVAFCDYFGANSTSNITFNSYNNTKLETLVIILKASSILSTAEKLKIASIIAGVLITKKSVWIDEDVSVKSSTSSRILQGMNSNLFYILPNYTNTEAIGDAEITVLKEIIGRNPEKFVNKVNGLSGKNFQDLYVASYVSTAASPILYKPYPSINVNETNFNFTLRQTGTPGYINWAYKEVNINLDSALSFISDSDFINLKISGLNKIEVANEKDVIISCANLIANTSYAIYYYGENNGLPRMKTPIYKQIVTTNVFNYNGSMRYDWLSILISMSGIIIFIIIS